MNTAFVLNPLVVARDQAPRRVVNRTARDRAYRRALRAAEQAAWDAADPKAITRLPQGVEQKDSMARVLLSLVAFASVAALVFGAKSSFGFTAAWGNFVAFVANLIG